MGSITPERSISGMLKKLIAPDNMPPSLMISASPYEAEAMAVPINSNNINKIKNPDTDILSPNIIETPTSRMLWIISVIVLTSTRPRTSDNLLMGVTRNRSKNPEVILSRSVKPA